MKRRIMATMMCLVMLASVWAPYVGALADGKLEKKAREQFSEGYAMITPDSYIYSTNYGADEYRIGIVTDMDGYVYALRRYFGVPEDNPNREWLYIVFATEKNGIIEGYVRMNRLTPVPAEEVDKVRQAGTVYYGGDSEEGEEAEKIPLIPLKYKKVSPPKPTKEPKPTKAPLPTPGDIKTMEPHPSMQPIQTKQPKPTKKPTPVPTVEPTKDPTPVPTAEPTKEPTPVPTAEPTKEPTPVPTAEPTKEPTPVPTAEPTKEPTPVPTAEPTKEPTPVPTAEPTKEPTPVPTAEPTKEPTPVPTAEPTIEPTAEPTVEPSVEPTVDPTVEPSVEPTVDPTVEPSVEPTVDPTVEPSVEPTVEPTVEPSVEPTVDPTVEPSIEPTVDPTVEPSIEPTVDPTVEPSIEPTVDPTVEPSIEPSVEPTVEPVVEPLTIEWVTSQRSVFANEESIEAQLTIAGGLGAYTVSVQVFCGEETVFAAEPVVSEELTYAFMYMPTTHGMHTLKVDVVDAQGAAVSAEITMPVAVHNEDREWEWTREFRNFVASGDYRADLVTIAQTQLGYTESETDFYIDDNGEYWRYTKYGAWYHSAYSPWCAMFAAFCLHYAGITEDLVPYDASCSAWIDALNAMGVYQDVSTGYQPVYGDLVFFKLEGGSQTHHVGIVESVADGRITAIEGNRHNCVERNDYALDHSEILGYLNLSLVLPVVDVTTVAVVPEGAVYSAEATYKSDVLPEGVQFAVTEITADSPAYAGIVEQLSQALLAKHEVDPAMQQVNYSMLQVFDLSFQQDDVLTEPAGEVTVSLMPAGVFAAPVLAHFAQDGVELLDAAYENGVLTFVVDAFSTFTVADYEITDIEWLCGIAPHSHVEACYDAAGALICTMAEHMHSEACLVEPTYYCYAEEHVHAEACYDATGALVCALAEHEHTADCLVVPTYYCYAEEHVHAESCYSADGVLACELSEHAHTAACLIVPEYYCYQEVHAHTESCYGIDGVLVCELSEHEHTADCLIVPVYYCYQDVHVHTESCYSVDGVLACELSEHEHTADCLIVPVYYCYQDVHVHAESCYGVDGVLVCELSEHEHTATCLIVPTYYCYQEVHAHTESCYGVDGALACELNEHEHTAACLFALTVAVDTDFALVNETAINVSATALGGAADYTYTLQVMQGDVVVHEETATAAEGTYAFAYVPAVTGEMTLKVTAADGYNRTAEELVAVYSATAEEYERVQNLIDTIAALPSDEELDALYENAEDEEGVAALMTAIDQVKKTHLSYISIEEHLAKYVTNDSRIEELEWLWSAATFAVLNQAIKVISINEFNWSTFGYAVLVHKDTGTTVANSGVSDPSFKYWTAIVVEPAADGSLYVTQVNRNEESKASMYASGQGFILLVHANEYNANDVSVGNYVSTESTDFWKTNASKAYNGSTVYGTVTFSTSFQPVASPKPAKNNGVSTIKSADTSEFIDVNLYDYTGSINNNYNSNHAYPGFQYPGGVRSIGSSIEAGEMDFGDLIVENFTTKITLAKAESADNIATYGKINTLAKDETGDYANRPIRDAIRKTLVNGYPHLAQIDASLDYLFNSTYKVNNGSINGLFIQNAKTGAYVYNSHNNHAQYDRENNRFLLYDGRITSNYIQYPFGNFLPFNRINQQTTQASEIKRDYFTMLANSAKYNSSNEMQATLSSVLTEFISLMDAEYGKDSWDGTEPITKYFKLADPPDIEWTTNMLKGYYNIDFDEKTNFFFGMDMKMNFMQPKNGITGPNNDQKMVFEFHGDDDVWVFIDGVLFLELSGIHRHVGGTIDFVNGLVHYKELNVETGDVDKTYKTETFAEILKAAGKSTDVLNDKGTFKDYSTHSFNFYYMERGSGSSVCRMNFNFPLLKKNTISVMKDISVDSTNVDVNEVLGNIDYKFQVLKAGTEGTNLPNDLFIKAGTSYTVYDTHGTADQADDTKVEGNFATDANGVFTLKAGQRAEFAGINENAGKYYVRELLDDFNKEQYGTISVDGSSVTKNDNDVTVGSDTFVGVDSSEKDASDGSTVFQFNNKITTAKLGGLQLTKTVERLDGTASNETFIFTVKLNGAKLPVGTKYKVGDVEKTVTTAGQIVVGAGETAVIENILAGSTYEVTEVQKNDGDVNYQVILTDVSTGTIQAEKIAGAIVLEEHSKVSALNKELGARVDIPVTKNISYADGLKDRAYTFELVRVDNALGSNPDTANKQTITITVPAGYTSAVGAFALYYRSTENMAGTYYYKITEVNGGESDTVYDTTAYIVKVDVVGPTIDEQTKVVTYTATATIDGVADKPVTFTNQLFGDLEIGKIVTAADGFSSAKDATFTMQVTVGGAPYTGAYDVLDAAGNVVETRTAGADGTVTLKAGQKVKIANLPAGADYVVEEVNHAAYDVTYTNETGKIVAGTTVSVTVANDEQGTELQIPVTKTVPNFEGAQRTYTFDLVQVQDVAGTVMSDAWSDSVTITINGTSAVEELFKVISYREVDLNGAASATYYYKITERIPIGTTDTDYDESVYVVEVTITAADPKPTAVITAVYKNGTKLENADSANPGTGFVNTLLGDLAIGKTVIDYPSANITSTSFDIVVTFTKNDEVLTEDIVCNVNGKATTVSKGQLTLSLKHGEKATITGLPAGIGYKITEPNPGTYNAVITPDSGVIATGVQASVMVTNTKNCTEIDLPVMKNVVNADDTERTYTFELVPVADENGSSPEESEKQTATVKLTGNSATVENAFHLAYSTAEFDTPAVFYYRITEVNGELAGVVYDTTVYIATVEVTTDGNGLLQTNVTYKADNKAATGVVFENVLLGSMSVEKEVVDYTVDGTTKFPITVTFVKDGKQLSGSLQCKVNGKAATIQDGQITVSLGDGEKVTITELPVGITYTVTEQKPSDYDVSIVNATGTIGAGTTATVKVINTKNHTEIELPVTKTVTNDDGEARTFKFELVEMMMDENDAFVATSNKKTLTLAWPTEKNGVFGFTYGMVDADKTFYYKITEVNDGSAGVVYDTTEYLATVQVVKDEQGLLRATVVYTLDGQTAENVAFNNMLQGDVTIGKQLTPVDKENNDRVFKLNVAVNGEPIAKNATYTVGGKTRTVTTAGVIELTAGEVATLSGLPTGAVITVAEDANSALGYTVAYTVNGETVDTASATVTTGDTVAIVVNNTEKSAGATIPVGKTVPNNDDAERTYTFALEEVDANGTAVTDGENQTIAVTVPAGQHTAVISTDAFTLLYQGADIASFPATFRYKVTEIINNTIYPNIQYDASEQYVTVTVDDSMAATVTYESGNAPAFTNTLLGGLSITKQVAGTSDNLNAIEFTMQVKVGGQLLPEGTQYTVDGETRTVGKDGTIVLKAGETAIINGLEAGKSYEVVEIGAVDFDKTYTNATGTITYNTLASVSIKNAENGIDVDIPVTKTVVNDDGKTRTYTFNLVEVNADGSTKTDGVAKSATIILPMEGATNATLDNAFEFTYKASEIGELPATFYYKITEATGTDASIHYDNAVYIVTVKISRGADGALQQSVTYKVDGVNGNAIVFENEIVGKLTITKQLTGYNNATPKNAKFTVKATVKVGNELLPVGYVCTVNGSEYKVATAGEILVTISNGQKITIDGLPHGASYAIEEIGADAYTVNYENQTGTITSGSAAAVIVKNAEQGVTLPIPVTKRMSVDDNVTRTFTFAMIEVADANGAPKTGAAAAQTQTITINADGVALATGEAFKVDYREADFAELEVGSTVKYYYKIKEVIPAEDRDATIAYDESELVVEVTVTVTELGIAASITAVYENGTELMESTVLFINTVLGDLSITKIVEGPYTAGTKFDFELNSAALAGLTVKTEEHGDIIFNTNGVATVQLAGGETITLLDLPVGTTIKVTETSHDGYGVWVSHDGTNYADSFGSIEGTVTKSDGTTSKSLVTLYVKNVSSSKLPATGSMGTTWYTMGGALLMLASLLLYKNKLYRKEGRRENT